MRTTLSLLATMAMLVTLSGCETIPTAASANLELVDRAGCTQVRYYNPHLQNDQEFVVPGGECGGYVTFDAYFAGRAEFIDAGDDHNRRAEASFNITETTNNNRLRCPERPAHSDRIFNTFNLRCPFTQGIAPNTTARFVLHYSTNNVSNNPLPTLRVTMTYRPQR